MHIYYISNSDFLQLKHYEAEIVKNAPTRITEAMKPTKRCRGIFCKDEEEENYSLLSRMKQIMINKKLIKSDPATFFLSKLVVKEYNKLATKYEK